MELSLQILPPSIADLISGTPRSTRFFLGKLGSSGAKMLLSEWVCSSEPLGVSRASFCDGNSSSFCPLRLRRAGLMRGRRKRRDPELEVTEPATDGAGDGMREGTPLPDSREKGSDVGDSLDWDDCEAGRLPLNK